LHDPPRWISDPAKVIAMIKEDPEIIHVVIWEETVSE
jgi:hypothetical protein